MSAPQTSAEEMPAAPPPGPVDVLIQTFNEELNLSHTLATVAGWANRIFIVDSGSTDRTRQIAEQFGAQFIHHDWEGYARQKNWALANLPFDAAWTLILDADESLTPELKAEIDQIVRRPPENVKESGFYLNRVFVFLGEKIWHCGYFPSWNLRLFKRGQARYEDRKVHEHMIVDGPTAYLKHWMIHEDRRGMEHLFAKHNRYSTLEAQEILESPEPWPGLRRFLTDRPARRRFGKSRLLPMLPVPWLWRFLYMYVGRLGFLDGRAGWWLCSFLGKYEFLIQIKLRDLKRHGGTARIPSMQGLSQAEGSISESAHLHQTPASPEGANESLASSRRQTEENRDSNGHPPQTTSLRTDLDPNTARLMSPWTFKEKIGRVLWMFARFCLFRPSFHNWYGWRRGLLRLFGARIARDVRIRPTAAIEIPWNVEIGEETIIGDYAIIYSLGRITIGRRVVVSQYAHICAGTHDYRYREFPLLKPPITIQDDAWIAADAFVGPGITIGQGAILGARASAFKDIPPWKIAVGNPAEAIKDRERLK